MAIGSQAKQSFEVKWHFQGEAGLAVGMGDWVRQVDNWAPSLTRGSPSPRC